MTTAQVISPAGKAEATLTLPAEIFDVQANIPVMHQVVVAQLAAARQGTASVKSRGEVAGGGKKPYRQKGTGRARQGSIRAPQFVGGGIVHGPTPHGYSQRTPKKLKVLALRGALSDRARAGKVHVLTGVVDGDTPSTKAAAAALASIDAGRHVLVVLTREDIAAAKSLRNLPDVHTLVADQLNTYDVLCADDVVFTRAALDAFLAANGAEVTEAAAKKAPAKKAPAKKADEAAEKPAPKKAPAKKTDEAATEAAADVAATTTDEEESK